MERIAQECHWLMSRWRCCNSISDHLLQIQMQWVKGHSTFLTNKTDLNLCCWYLWLESQVRWTGVLPLIPANPQDVCVHACECVEGERRNWIMWEGEDVSCGYFSLHPAFTLFPFSSLSINLGSFFPLLFFLFSMLCLHSAVLLLLSVHYWYRTSMNLSFPVSGEPMTSPLLPVSLHRSCLSLRLRLQPSGWPPADEVSLRRTNATVTPLPFFTAARLNYC